MVDKELRNKQRLETIERLEILEKEYLLHKNVLAEFKQNGTIYYSENLGGAFSGILYWVHNKEEFTRAVKEIEEKRNIFVYHCILNHTEIGDLLTMLYVSDDEENWKYERQELLGGFVNAYVCNLSCELDSEFGGTQITGVNGGLCRLY